MSNIYLRGSLNDIQLVPNKALSLESTSQVISHFHFKLYRIRSPLPTVLNFVMVALAFGNYYVLLSNMARKSLVQLRIMGYLLLNNFVQADKRVRQYFVEKNSLTCFVTTQSH